MLEFEFGEEMDAVRELVPEVQNEAMEVDLLAVSVVGADVVVVQFAVTADRRPAGARFRWVSSWRR